MQHIAITKPQRRQPTRLRFRFTVVVALAAILARAPDVVAQTLSKEGQEQKAINDFLFNAFATGRKARYVGSGPDRGLKELTILDEAKVIRHGDELLLPTGAERIAVLFRHVGFHGADLDRISEIRVLPFSPDKPPPRSVQVKDFYRLQMPSLPLTDQPFDRMKIRFAMKD